MNPHELQRTTARTLQLVIDNLPNLPGNYVCAFSAIGKVNNLITINSSIFKRMHSLGASVISIRKPLMYRIITVVSFVITGVTM